MKKRLLTLVLTLVMVFSFSLTAFAATTPADKAVAKALADAGLTKTQVTKLKVKLDGTYYDVEFTKKSNKAEYDYEISLNGKTVLEKNAEYVYTRNSSKAKIGKVAAQKKVAAFSKAANLKDVQSGTCTYKYSDKEGIYTVKFKKAGYRYEYKVLAPTGKVIEMEKELINR